MTTDCRRCSECQGEEHHFLPDAAEFENDEGNECEPFIPCKHCDARAAICDECMGPVFPAGPELCEDCRAEEPYVCPGCHAIDSDPHAGYCPDAAIGAEREDDLQRSFDFDEDQEP